jgi:hypothetical protein
MRISDINLRTLYKVAGSQDKGVVMERSLRTCMTRLEDIGIKLTSLTVDGPYVIKMEGVYSDWSVVIWLHNLPGNFKVLVVPTRISKGEKQYGRPVLAADNLPSRLKVTLNLTLDFALNREVIWGA